MNRSEAEALLNGTESYKDYFLRTADPFTKSLFKEQPRKTASLNMPAGRALKTGWWVFWTALWQLVRHPRKPAPIEFSVFEE